MKKIIITLIAIMIMPILTSAQETENPKSFTKFGIYYKTTSFDAFKEAGGYGLDGAVYFRCGGESSKGYLGFTFQVLQFNFGLVEKGYTSDQMAIGLSPMLYINDSFQLMCPFNVTVNTAFSEEMKKLLGKKSVWAFEIVPQIRFSLLDVGLVFSKGFTSGSKFSTGIYLGLAF